MRKTDLGYTGFSAVRGHQDFGRFWEFSNIFEFFLTENRCVPVDSDAYHGPCSCPTDSFEDFDSHWSRGERFGRPKLKLHRRKIFQNPILAKYAPDWDFAQILVYFLKILDFAALVVAGTP